MTVQPYCFCDLAPLYALGLLDDAERQWVEQQLLECPELSEELVDYEAAAAAIPYSAPEVPIAADLKDRLFERLSLEPPAQPPAPAQPDPPPIPQFLTIRSQEIEWRPHRVPGVMISVFYADPVRQEISGLVRAEPNVQYPFHQHADTEEIYMLAGDLIIGDQVYGAGDYIRSHAGSAHAPRTVGGCMFFVRTSINDDYPDREPSESLASR